MTTSTPKKSTTMQVRSTYRFARISAFKAREVTREIQGLPASDALDLLRFVPKKAAGLVRKTLASAVANAENNNNLNVANLVVQEAVVGRRSHLKALSTKSPWQRGPDPQAHQPHTDHPYRRDRNKATRERRREEIEEIRSAKGSDKQACRETRER